MWEVKEELVDPDAMVSEGGKGKGETPILGWGNLLANTKDRTHKLPLAMERGQHTFEASNEKFPSFGTLEMKFFSKKI